MIYIFDKNRKCVGYSDKAVNIDDLASRGEFAIEDERVFSKLDNVEFDIDKSVIVEVIKEVEKPKIDYESIRNNRLDKTDWMITRHTDEGLLGEGTTLSDEEFKGLLLYRKALRDMKFVGEKTVWPDKPSFL